MHSLKTIQDNKKKPYLKPSAPLGQFKYELNVFVILISNATYKQFERNFQIRF